MSTVDMPRRIADIHISDCQLNWPKGLNWQIFKRYKIGQIEKFTIELAHVQ